jgi:hypothetical protein
MNSLRIWVAQMRNRGRPAIDAVADRADGVEIVQVGEV